MPFTTLALTLWAALAAPEDAPRPRPVTLGERFALRTGEAAAVESEKLEVRFDEVVSDSRCPKGVQCIAAGDATIRITVQKASARSSHELHTEGRAGQEASVDGLTIRLLGLDPYPVDGKATDPRAYLATLRVTRGPSNDPAAPQP